MSTPSPAPLELADIQGNILTAYGKLGFPKGRCLLLTIRDPAAGRALVERLRHRVTTALRWPSARKGTPTGAHAVPRPDVTLNLAFTFEGLLALRVPTRTLRAARSWAMAIARRGIRCGWPGRVNGRMCW